MLRVTDPKIRSTVLGRTARTSIKLMFCISLNDVKRSEDRCASDWTVKNPQVLNGQIEQMVEPSGIEPLTS